MSEEQSPPPMARVYDPSLPPLVPPPGPLKRGVLNAAYVRIAAFAVISLSIMVCAVVCLLAVWDYADRNTAWKALVSLGIIAAAMAAFVVVNESFGASLRNV